MKLLKRYYENFGVYLTDDQCKTILNIDSGFASVGYPGFAEFLAPFVSRLTPVVGDAAGSNDGDGQALPAAQLKPGR